MKNLITLISTSLLIGLFSSSLFAAGQQTLSINKLTENVFSIFLQGYTSLIVIGDEKVLITDTANPYRASILKQEIKKLTTKPVGYIVLTHEHFDHTGGTKVFEKAHVVIQQNALQLNTLDPLDLFPDNVDITFDKDLTLDMGTTKVTLLHMGIADGIANTLVSLPTEKIVLTADLYVDQGLSKGAFLTDTNLLGNRKILNQIADWDLNYSLTTHAATTDPAVMRAVAQFYNDLYDQVMPMIFKTLKQNPAALVPTVMQFSEDLKMPAYRNWNNYQDLNDFSRKMAFAIIHGG